MPKSPLQLFQSFFGSKPSDPSKLRIVSPRHVRPDELRDMYVETMRPLDSIYQNVERTPRGYKGAAYDELVDRTATDQGLLMREADEFVQNELKRLSTARNFVSDAIREAEEGSHYTQRFMIDPVLERVLGSIQTDKIKPTARLGRMAGTGDIEEIKSLGAMMPGTGRPLLRAAQGVYDPDAKRATSLMSLPKAEPFYERLGMQKIPEHGYRGEDWNFQSHVLPKGERFNRGGLARCRNA